MRKVFKKITKSLTGRLTIFFILVHLATVIGITAYQSHKYMKQIQAEESAPVAIAYILEDIFRSYPDVDLTDKTPPLNSAPLPVKDWHNVLMKNPDLWFYYETPGKVIQYGRSPVLIDDILSAQAQYIGVDNQSKNGPLCINGSSETLHEGYKVVGGFQSCHTDRSAYELGGMEASYSQNSRFNFLTVLREDLRLWPALLGYIGLILLMPLFIYGLVSPIRRASKAALNISPYSKRKLLPVEGMLSEVKGLADATNTALTKLDAGYVRERWLRDVIAHELRTPLMVLRGHVESISDDDARRDLTEDLKRTNKVLDRLMEFSVATSLASEPEPLKTVEVIRAACAEAGAFAAGEGAELNLIADPGNSVHVKANRVALMLIVTNLLNNAVRHSGSELPIDVEVFADGEVQIRDCGKGMDISALNTFFQRFASLEERLVQRRGLGLIIVAELVEFSGGAISAFKTDGGGVGFSLRMPIAGDGTKS